MTFSNKTALRLSAALIAIQGTYAQAQTVSAPKPTSEPAAAAAPDEAGKEIVVTGSRIPRPQFEGIIPGAQVTAQDIATRGFTNVLDALNDNPLVGPGASPTGNAGGQPASLGAAFVDLLDLGTNRTLTLVNGKRFVSGNAGSLFVAGNTTGGQVDLNTIPTELVSRVDVLTVGGAVAYGSDAIAGVVNLILKKDYEGLSINARAGVSSRGDLGNQQLGFVAGLNFADGRGNVTVSGQYNRDDGLQGNDRDNFNPAYIAPTFFRNGAVRNSAFGPAIPIDVTGANNGAFLRSTDDGVPGNQSLPLLTGGTILFSDGGRVFQYTGTALPAGITSAASTSAFIYASQAGSIQNLAGTTQAVPGGGVAGTAGAGLSGNAPAVGNAATLPANTFTRFAPTSLPTGVTATQVIQALAPGFAIPAGATAGQLTTLAVNLLQANRPTPREYLAANPNTPINAFLGSFVGAFLDVPNTDAASAAFLPRAAVPLEFNSSGQLVTYNPGRFTAAQPATLGGIPGGDFYNATAYTVLRTQQDRYIANLNGRFDITPNLTFYTQNQFARVENVALRNTASGNTLSSGATETAVIVANINNPFLTAAQRAQLTAAGVPTTGATAGLFLLSRTNQDITGDNRAFTTSNTFRTSTGVEGEFGLFGRKFKFDVGVVYGQSNQRIGTRGIRDVEYALALDAVQTANGIVCRVQTPGASTALPLGVTNTVLVREPDANGVLVERIVTRTVTPQQIAGCSPLNPFGVNQASEAAKQYVIFDAVAKNRSIQKFAQASLATSSLIGLPGGGLGVALNGEVREETLDYRPNDEQRFGVSRTAALAATRGVVRSYEISAEGRIPIFGGDFTIPLFHSLEFAPGVRFVKQDGDAPDVRRLNGALETNESKGKWQTLVTLAGTWQPIPDVLFRGNFTRSIRQPSVVELFLGNQPAFNTPTDPCGNANIGSGSFAANRRANCEQEVVRLGIAPDRASAATFLNTFVPAGQSLQGGFAGSPNLLPEKGKSYTFGGVLTPRFVRNLVLSADYINVEVRNVINPTTLSTAAQFCYDSATFGSTVATLGVNTCSFFDREPTTTGGSPQFNIRNGFASGFINLGALKVKAINASATYKFNVADVIGGDSTSKINLSANVYHLMNYILSGSGNFDDNQDSAGSFFRPKWKVQLTGRYEGETFYGSWTWNWQPKTRIFNANLGAFNTIEQSDVFEQEAYGVHDATLGIKVNKKFSMQLTVRNIFDKQYAGINGFGNAASALGASGEVDPFGRRFQLTARANF